MPLLAKNNLSDGGKAMQQVIWQRVHLHRLRCDPAEGAETNSLNQVRTRIKPKGLVFGKFCRRKVLKELVCLPRALKKADLFCRGSVQQMICVAGSSKKT